MKPAFLPGECGLKAATLQKSWETKLLSGICGSIFIDNTFSVRQGSGRERLAVGISGSRRGADRDEVLPVQRQTRSRGGTICYNFSLYPPNQIPYKASCAPTKQDFGLPKSATKP